MEEGKIDLVIVLDSTASMSKYYVSLKQSLEQISIIILMTGAINSITIVDYKDYTRCGYKHDEYAVRASVKFTDFDSVIKYLNSITITGGGDVPEAAKTAANKLLEIADGVTTTICFWYTDAPPHSILSSSPNCKSEKNAIQDYDWVSLCNKLATKKIRIFPIVSGYVSWYIHMANITGGITKFLTDIDPKYITESTIEIFLRVLGLEHGDISCANFNIQKVAEDEESWLKIYENCRTINVAKQICPSIQVNTEKMLNLFADDMNFRGLIYKSFDILLEPTYMMSLTYVEIFGKYWRAICRDKSDPRYKKLTDKISSSKIRLSSPNKNAFDEWLESSYNRIEEINTLIESAEPKVPALCYRGGVSLKIDEIMSIARSCDSDALKSISHFLTTLDKIDCHEQNSIPLSLNKLDVFMLLPHLISPGIMFSPRPAMILAIVAYITNSILKDAAALLLKENIGKWINLDASENFSYGFIDLVMKVEDFLTPEEKNTFTLCKKILGLQCNVKSSFCCETKVRPYKTALPDFKRECGSCGNFRSFTTLSKDPDYLTQEKYKCGLCFADFQAPEQLDNESYYVQCTVPQCGVKYAVTCTYDLLPDIKPKCHGCRHNIQLGKVKCVRCQDIYLDNANIFCVEDFECPVCKNNIEIEKNVTTRTLSDIISENPYIIKMLGIGYTKNEVPFDKLSLYKNRNDICHIPLVPKNDTDTIICDRSMFIKGNWVINQQEIESKIYELILSGTAQKDYCMICFEKFNKKFLHQMCTNNDCRSVACSSCIESWYNENSLGNILCVNRIQCPFCRKTPDKPFFKRYKSQNYFFMDSIDYDRVHQWWYGWCRLCNKIDPYVEKTCHQDKPELSGNFECDMCKKVEMPTETKQCPNIECGIYISKKGGCNHMKCSMCKTHFCWLCTDTCYENGYDVYDHLSEIHGSYN